MGKGKGGPRRNGYFLLELGGRIVSRKVVKRIPTFFYIFISLLLLGSVYHCRGIFLSVPSGGATRPVHKGIIFFSCIYVIGYD